MRSKRCLALVFLCFLCVLCYYVIAPRKDGLSSNYNDRQKTILMWTTKSGRTKWFPNTLKRLPCLMKNCRTTGDRRLAPVSDAIVFHLKDIHLKDLPTFQRTQSWILLNHEPPPQTPRQIFKFLNGKISWTVTYRRDSDIYAPVYALERTNRSSLVRITQTTSRFSNKKLITWLVSHCTTSGNREGFVAELQTHVDVDVWGRCGRTLRICPKQARFECYQRLSERYKFYLSLENSLCKDYVTEKLYLALKAGMVPVVFGGADYKKILPPFSYIDGLSFANVRLLAEYITMVGSNYTLYSKYLEWRSSYSVFERRYHWLCDVCQKLNEPQPENKISNDLMSWWYADGQCRVWSE